jgi:hypothetical protein
MKTSPTERVMKFIAPATLGITALMTLAIIFTAAH